MVAELLDLSSATRPELFHNRLLFSCAGVQQLQNLSAHLGRYGISNLDGYKNVDGVRDKRRDSDPSSHPPYLLALLLFSGLLVQEALYLHVNMRRLAFAAPPLLLCAAP